MNTQRLYESWGAAKTAVVQAATAYMLDRAAKSELSACLIAERVARARFDAAIRAEMTEQVLS